MVSLPPHDPPNFAPSAAPGRLLSLIRGAVATPGTFSSVGLLGDSNVTYPGTALIGRTDFMCNFRAWADQQFSVAANAADSNVPYFGISGAPVQQFHAEKLAAVLATGVEAVLVGPCTNNYAYSYGGDTSDTPAEAGIYLAALIDAILAAGRVPIVLGIFPVPSGYALRSAWISQFYTVRDAVLGARPEAIYVPSYLVLDSNRDGVANSDGYLRDSLHLGTAGGSRLGKLIYDSCGAYIEPGDCYGSRVCVTGNPLFDAGAAPGTG